MKPEDYYIEIVYPTLLEFKEEPTSRRRAYLACITLFQALDFFGGRKKSQLKKEFSSEIGDNYHLVRSVANSAKHNTLDQRHRIEISAGEDTVREPAIIGRMQLGYSLTGDTSGSVEVKHEGKTYDVLQCVILFDNHLCKKYNLNTK